MNVIDIHKAIAQIASTSARTEKQALIAKMVEHDLGQFVVKQAYDPFTTYGLTPRRRSKSAAGSMLLTIELVKPLLDKLATRELTGNAAQEAVQAMMDDLCEQSADILFKILSKDMKAGFSESSVNIVMPGLIPVFRVMLAKKYEQKKVEFPRIVEPKYDGVRALFVAREGKGGFFTRTGKPMPALAHLVRPIQETARNAVLVTQNEGLADILHTGEFVIDGEVLTGSFNDTVGAVRRQNEPALGAEFWAFDIMSRRCFDAGESAYPFEKRREQLDALLETSEMKYLRSTPCHLVENDDAVQKLYAEFQAAGLEGAMVKDPHAHYINRRSAAWMKIKSEETIDLVVTGAFAGEPGTKYEHCLGGLIVDHGGVSVRVGGGFSDQQREDLWRAYENDLRCAGEGVGSVVGGELIDRMIEIEYHEVTPDGSLRHPRFVRFRDDKHGEEGQVAA